MGRGESEVSKSKESDMGGERKTYRKTAEYEHGHGKNALTPP
jgi:hypothetical protein